MAPEVALQKIELLTNPGGVVLDPMCGSGTVVRAAAERSRKGIGCDLDPLAVLISQVACRPSWSRHLGARAEAVVRQAKHRRPNLPYWISSDEETRRFVEYWFGPDQIADLARISKVLIDLPRRDNALRVALSRLIVTKDAGASLARDTAHSRPHRVRLESDFNIFDSYVGSAEFLEKFASLSGDWGRSSVRRADARNLGFVPTGSVDLAITSPPYLNAIDYLRGHRMSLVWMGWTVSELRSLRGQTIGAERSIPTADPRTMALAGTAVAGLNQLSARHRGMVLRFTRDIDRTCRTLGRVVKRNGHAVLIVADSQLKGVPVENAAICALACKQHSLEVVDRQVRPLPAHHRYLPPPAAGGGTLGKRMKDEIILTLRKVDGQS